MKLVPPPNPGVYQVEAEVYHSWDAVSASRLKDFSDAPARCKYFTEHSKNVTAAMKLGSAVHCILLEGMEAFQDRYVTVKTDNPHSKAARDAKHVSIEEFGEEFYLPYAEYAKAIQICSATLNDPAIRNLLESLTHKETSFVWVDERTGLTCKARVDGISSTCRFLLDIKTCPDAHPVKFFFKAWDELHHVQLAHYMAGAAVHSIPLDIAVVVAVEKGAAPHLCGAYSLTPDFLKAGVEAREVLMTQYLESLRTNSWPSYGVRDLEIPKWAVKYVQRMKETTEEVHEY